MPTLLQCCRYRWKKNRYDHSILSNFAHIKLHLILILWSLKFLLKIAKLQGLLKVIAGIEISFTLTSKSAAEDEDDIFADLYEIKWTSLFIPPLAIITVNIVAIVVGFSRTVYSEIPQWSKLLGGVFFSSWVLAHMYPFCKGLMGRRGRVPTIVFVWVGLLAIVVSLLWITISPPTTTTDSASSGNVDI